MVDKNFCMSSYLAFRYIERRDVEFYPGIHHELIKPIPDNEKHVVFSPSDIDNELRSQFKLLKEKKLGILLSGGMDSAILASYMRGSDAYTFRFLDGQYQGEELERAKYYSKKYNLTLHYVDIQWDTVCKYLKKTVIKKAAPVHSIEPQIVQAAEQAKEDGIEVMIVGESSDLIFGGMDKLLAKDWSFDEFKERYIFLKPEMVLKNPVDMSYLFERYRIGSKIDYLKFMDDVFSIESSSSYYNAFGVAELDYVDPYAMLKLGDKLDLKRIRNGESKYLIRNLFHLKYDEIPIPNKIPMPRPVDKYFETWTGPERNEFDLKLPITSFSGNQKWQIYCLEYFLNMYEN